MALLTLGSANALFAAKSKSAVKKVGGGEKSTSSQQYTFGIKEPKTGGIVGGEFGIGSATAGIRIDGAYGIASYPIVPLNIFGGYQWYFYDRPHYTFGVRVRGHIGYTNYNTTFKGLYSSASLTSNSIQYGVEGQLLWDFLDYKEHTADLQNLPHSKFNYKSFYPYCLCIAVQGGKFKVFISTLKSSYNALTYIHCFGDLFLGKICFNSSLYNCAF